MSTAVKVKGELSSVRWFWTLYTTQIYSQAQGWVKPEGHLGTSVLGTEQA